MQSLATPKRTPGVGSSPKRVTLSTPTPADEDEPSLGTAKNATGGTARKGRGPNRKKSDPPPAPTSQRNRAAPLPFSARPHGHKQGQEEPVASEDEDEPSPRVVKNAKKRAAKPRPTAKSLAAIHPVTPSAAPGTTTPTSGAVPMASEDEDEPSSGAAKDAKRPVTPSAAPETTTPTSGAVPMVSEDEDEPSSGAAKDAKGGAAKTPRTPKRKSDPPPAPTSKRNRAAPPPFSAHPHGYKKGKEKA